MHILLVEYEIELPACHSLKDKRSVLKSLIHRLRTGWNVSVAESGRQDAWQRSTLAVVAVATLKDTLEEIERAVARTIETGADVRLGEVRREWL